MFTLFCYYGIYDAFRDVDPTLIKKIQFYFLKAKKTFSSLAQSFIILTLGNHKQKKL